MNFLLKDALNADAINVACIEVMLFVQRSNYEKSLLKVASERNTKPLSSPSSFKGKVATTLVRSHTVVTVRFKMCACYLEMKMKQKEWMQVQ